MQALAGTETISSFRSCSHSLLRKQIFIMKYLVLAVIVLFGGANAGGLLGLDNVLGLGDALGCDNYDYDIYFAFDASADIGVAAYKQYIIDASVELFTKLQVKARSVRAGAFFITGADYNSYVSVCSLTADAVAFKASLLAAADAYFSSHSCSPIESFYGSLKYTYEKRVSIYTKTEVKKKLIIFTHDTPASEVQKRSFSELDSGCRQYSDSLKADVGVEIVAVPIQLTGQVGFSLDVNGLLAYVTAVVDQFGTVVRTNVFYCTALGDLLNLVLQIVNSVLCLVLGILG